MNNNRRKRIQNVIEQLNTCSSTLEDIKAEEDETREDIPENLQGAETYCLSEECSDKIEDAISGIQEVVSNLENIT